MGLESRVYAIGYTLYIYMYMYMYILGVEYTTVHNCEICITHIHVYTIKNIYIYIYTYTPIYVCYIGFAR